MPRALPPSLRRLAPWLLLLAAVLSLSRFRDPVHVLDDAWISFRFARSWLETGLLTFDASQPMVEGVSNPLWTALAALWIAVGLDPVTPARLLGALCFLATVLVVGRAAALLAEERGGEPTLALLVGGGLVALDGGMAFNAMGGLESASWYLLAAWGALLVVSQVCGPPSVARSWWLGVTCAGLCLSRPEGPLVASLLTAGFAWLSPRDRKSVV